MYITLPVSVRIITIVVEAPTVPKYIFFILGVSMFGHLRGLLRHRAGKGRLLARRRCSSAFLADDVSSIFRAIIKTAPGTILLNVAGSSAYAFTRP